MSIRILVGCRLDMVNPHDFVSALATREEIDLYVVTDSKNHRPVSGLDNSHIYHYHPTWPVIFSRLHPYDKRQFNEILSEIKPDVLLSTAVTHLTFMGPTTDFSPTVFLPQGGKVNSSTRKRCKNRDLGYRWVMYRPLMWELLRHVDQAWSAAPNESILSSLGLPDGRFRAFDWGVVNTETFRRRKDSVEFVDNPDTTVIGSFRRIRNPPLIPSYETFLNSVAKLRERRDDFHVVIGGFYEGENGQEVERAIDAKITEHELEDRVTRIDMIPKEEMPRYLSGLDVYVNFSPVGSFGGIGTAAKEGMACECAFVTFNEPPADYVVNHGENGLLATHGDIEGLAADLERLCSDTTYREELGRRARETVTSRFSGGAVSDRVIEFCRELTVDGATNGLSQG